MVSIQKNNDNETRPFCGGTVIDDRWVVTAKHCTCIFKQSEIIVVAGDHHLTETEGEKCPSLIINVPWPKKRKWKILTQFSEASDNVVKHQARW